MARSNIKAVFENDVQTVWNIITDVKNYIWRTDLSKTEIISDKQFGQENIHSSLQGFLCILGVLSLREFQYAKNQLTGKRFFRFLF